MKKQEEKKMRSVEEYWQDSQNIFSEIYKSGIKKYLRKVPALKKAFLLHDYSVRCIDEGTPGGIHIAGSGILLSTKEKKTELKKVVAELKRAGVDGVYSHEGCGAAKLYAETIMKEPDKDRGYAIDWAKELSTIIDVPYKGHIAELARPKEFHNARIIYYDGSGKFDPFKIKEIPDGFIISRYYLDQKYSKEELKIAISIALGHHGFGNKFTKDSPLIIAPIEGSENKTLYLSLRQLETEVKDVSLQFGERIFVKGFKEPK